ncbi:MAG: hypothetical protein Q8N12_01460 [Thermodesulfovibrionales bacterium]|nr:hypothetical protein [Thermodesulfovibrionales bacterium]
MNNTDERLGMGWLPGQIKGTVLFNKLASLQADRLYRKVGR